MILRRASVVAVSTVAAIAMSAGAANAHFCFNKHAVQQGAEGMANSEGFASFHDLAFEFTGLCDAGIEILADAAGVEPWTAINVRTVMAQGSQGKSQGIGYLDFEAIDAATPDAEDACGRWPSAQGPSNITEPVSNPRRPNMPLIARSCRCADVRVHCMSY
jgi:hypothetical protein